MTHCVITLKIFSRIKWKDFQENLYLAFRSIRNDQDKTNVTFCIFSLITVPYCWHSEGLTSPFVTICIVWFIGCQQGGALCGIALFLWYTWFHLTNHLHDSLCNTYCAGTSESGFLKFEKWKVKIKSFHSFSRSAKWNQNAFTLFREVKSEIKMLRDRDREVKILENS